MNLEMELIAEDGGKVYLKTPLLDALSGLLEYNKALSTQMFHSNKFSQKHFRDKAEKCLKNILDYKNKPADLKNYNSIIELAEEYFK